MSLVQLSRLLPLPGEELKQVLDYASTLSKEAAVSHFSNLLGDSPQVIEFVSSFNSKRADPRTEVEVVPESKRGPGKARPQIHTPAPRRVESLGPTPGTAYSKKGLEEDYISGQTGVSSANGKAAHTSQPSREGSTSTTPAPVRAPPSAAGTLISDLGRPKPKTKAKSDPISRTGTPGPAAALKNGNKSRAPSAKVSIVGGTAMHGASTVLADLDDAIRSLELSTNPSHASNEADARRCHCVATRHPLQDAAPNCLSCGKIVCLREGLGPCTFCGTPLISPADVQVMIRELKNQRGQEKMAADRERHKRAEVSTTSRPFATPRGQDLSLAEAKARDHRDRLLTFQAQNAKRTTVRDEAADFDLSAVGSIWASPEERARQLKRQQKLLREMAWNARPDHDKRRTVASIDLVGGKVVRQMVAVERPPSPDEGVEGPSVAGPVLGEAEGNRSIGGGHGGGGGAFSKNPLLGSMIKPVYDSKGKGQQQEGRKAKATRWRRVQDDQDDNEAVVLDGGLLGGREPACGRTSRTDRSASIM
ncbi:hypothetical protein P8C59_005537 [Phyllachora maydis]|uniref:TRIP4/RQT4 C2HC5-type zinc finger domain-containing protein n=1 Tax=Phyllachora maydis TaxID=1825666 RepID=A0AAD9MFL1_9PEZI|nr:hypothetical protein P8C59_005537 [Phyllachora maydis]